ncbi:hypothetical protein PCE1_000463 [Barthelona sp. PCE]
MDMRRSLAFTDLEGDIKIALEQRKRTNADVCIGRDFSNIVGSPRQCTCSHCAGDIQLTIIDISDVRIPNPNDRQALNSCLRKKKLPLNHNFWYTLYRLNTSAFYSLLSISLSEQFLDYTTSMVLCLELPLSAPVQFELYAFYLQAAEWREEAIDLHNHIEFLIG